MGNKFKRAKESQPRNASQATGYADNASGGREVEVATTTASSRQAE